MKRLFILITLTFFIFSCKDKSKHGKEYTAAYVCPMHCEGSGSDSPGKCPVCKMDYVKNEDTHSHEGHNHDGHDHEHDGHDHNHHDQSDSTHQH
jgi:hypothetical protein